MKLHVLNRKVHYWLAVVVAAPLLLVIGTGIPLLLRKELPWVQPPTKKGSQPVPQISFARVLEQCRTVPEAEVNDWDDIDRVDVRPGRGVIKVQCKNLWEIQLDGSSGKVMQIAYRRSDLLKSIHEGAWFHDTVRLGVFLPSAVILLLLWVTGMYLFWLPMVVKYRRRRAARLASATPVVEQGAS